MVAAAHAIGSRGGQPKGEKRPDSVRVQRARTLLADIAVEALAEYIVFISQTGSDYRHCDAFLREAERNLSFGSFATSSFCSDSCMLKCERLSGKTTRPLWIECGANLPTARAANKTIASSFDAFPSRKPSTVRFARRCTPTARTSRSISNTSPKTRR